MSAKVLEYGQVNLKLVSSVCTEQHKKTDYSFEFKTNSQKINQLYLNLKTQEFNGIVQLDQEIITFGKPVLILKNKIYRLTINQCEDKTNVSHLTLDLVY